MPSTSHQNCALTQSIEYDDDTTIIPRSTTVVAHRAPASRPGYGRAARYVSGKAPVNAKNTHRTEAAVSKPAAQAKATDTANGAVLNEAMTEEERIAAMFKASGDQWEQQKQQMAKYVIPCLRKSESR